jgi:hypothetical protein
MCLMGKAGLDANASISMDHYWTYHCLPEDYAYEIIFKEAFLKEILNLNKIVVIIFGTEIFM